MENKKITDEELKEIQTVVEQYENISFRIGQYTIEIESAKADRNTMITIIRFCFVFCQYLPYNLGFYL